VESLNDLWEFAFYPDRTLDNLELEDVCFTDKLPVPAAFDTFPKTLGKRGVGVYRHKVRNIAGTNAMLEFEAVSFACKVWVDGVCLCEHFCGYTPFEVMVPPSDSDVREIVVMTENRFDFERIPLHEHYFDFYQYGGIIRPVWFHHLPAHPLSDIRVEVTDLEKGNLRVSGQLHPGLSVSAEILDEPIPPVRGKAGADGRFELNLTIQKPRLWSPADPALYRVQVFTDTDDCILRFGFREVKASGKEVFLNGEPLRLFGFNRHEYFPNYGPSTPYIQQVMDLKLLKACGSNFVRGSHYPQSQLFLDLCDEEGLLVWEESLGWGQDSRQLTHPLFLEHHQFALEEMVRRSFHHPSVIIWGFLNEGPTDEDCFLPVLKQVRSYFREHGGNRLFAYASNRIERDRYFAEVDLICVNLYPGWYGAEGHSAPLSLIPKDFAEFIAHLEACGLGDKPLLVSEIGCEALYGVRDEMCDFHSEDYQRAYLATVCKEVKDNARFLGVCIWHFSDARTREHSVGRTRGYNNKGVFDEYRRPKLSRDPVTALFHEALPFS
jgi:beta-glucuronidase